MAAKYESTNSVTSNEIFVRGEPKPRSSSFIYVLTFFSTIGGFLFGYDMGVVSGVMLLISTIGGFLFGYDAGVVSGAMLLIIWVTFAHNQMAY